MYLILCINAENRDEGVENHSEGTQQRTILTPRRSDCICRNATCDSIVSRPRTAASVRSTEVKRHNAVTSI